MNKDDSIKNLEWIVSLRVLATISVIVLHVAAGITYQYGRVSNFDWWIANIYDSTVRFCVPIFLMITGTVVLNKPFESTREYLKKMFLRILLPFLFWSIIYIAKDLLLKFYHGESMNLIIVLKFIFLKCLLYFFYLI